MGVQAQDSNSDLDDPPEEEDDDQSNIQED
jgi:hypothetical protein